MAKKLDVTPAYLSAIECGKRNVHDNLINKIVALYNINENQKIQMLNAKEKSIKKIKIDLSKVSEKKRNLAVVFVNKFNTLDNKTTEEISKLL